MDRLIYTYALIKSLYDQGEDYIDCFWPFAIKAFPENTFTFVDCHAIQRKLKETSELDVPLHVLATILNRAQRRGYIEQRNKKKLFKLSEKGLKILHGLECDRDVERRTNGLVEDMRGFFADRDVSLSLDQIDGSLLSFLRKNIQPLTQFINPCVASNELRIEKPEGNEYLLIDYIKAAEQQKPEHYKAVQDMVLGSIISVVLYAKEPSEMTEITSRGFKHCQVFLDTNFVFSILDLATPELTQPAKELFALLKRYRFDVKVFDFTVNEICRVVGGYSTQSNRYPVSVGVDTLYSSLKTKGWSKTDAREFIMNVEDRLQREGIQITYETEVDINNYSPRNARARNLMGTYKPQQPLRSQNHDLAAIEKIRELRGKTARTLEGSKAFFLTSDAKLSKFSFLEMGHKENETVSEVILDRLLANILWLKDPSTTPPLKSIIAAFSRDLFIKRGIWDRFYEILQQLRGEQKVEDENISTLFYHGYIGDVLREFDESQADEITEELVLETIEQAAKLKEEKEVLKIQEKEKEFLRQLEEVKEEVARQEQIKEREWLERIEGIKRRFKESAEKNASRNSGRYASMLTVLVVGIMYGIYEVSKNLGIDEFLALVIIPLLGGGGIFGVWTRFRSYLKTWLGRRSYAQKLREANLGEETTK